MQPEIVWLDQNSQSTESFRQKLRDYPFIQIFHDVDTCMNHIATNQHKPLFLITSGTFAKIIVPQVVQYDHIKQIFVFCGIILQHAEWASDYVDRLLLFDHQDDLLQRLWLEMGQYFRSLVKYYTEQANLMKQFETKYKQACG